MLRCKPILKQLHNWLSQGGSGHSIGRDQTGLPIFGISIVAGHLCLVSARQNQTQMPTDRVFGNRGHACLVATVTIQILTLALQKVPSQIRF